MYLRITQRVKAQSHFLAVTQALDVCARFATAMRAQAPLGDTRINCPVPTMSSTTVYRGTP